jgi:hypothetical protein
MFVTPLLGENEASGCPIQRALENDFVVVTGTGPARVSGFSPSNCTAKSKRKPACQTCQSAHADHTIPAVSSSRNFKDALKSWMRARNWISLYSILCDIIYCVSGQLTTGCA